MSSNPPEIHSERLDNGVTLLFEPMPWLRSASLGLLVPMGAAGDPAGQDGSANVHAEWSGKGAGSLDARAYSAALDALGVRRGAGSDRTNSTMGASLLVDTMPQTLPLLASQVIEPRLDDAEFEKVRQGALQELASLQDQPTTRLMEALASAMFESGHGRSAFGTEEGLAAVTPDTVRADRAARFGAAGSILAVAGGIGWDELRSMVKESFGRWDGQASAAVEPVFRPVTRQHVTADTSQVQIGIGFTALAPDHPDWQLQSLAIGVLSGGMGARLFSEVREKRGLVYSVGAAARAVRGAGYILGYAGTTPQKAAETLEVMLAEFRRLTDGISAEELERARQGKLTRLIMQGESSSARASGLAADMHLRGRTSTLEEIAAEIRAVNLEQINDWLARQELPEPTIVTLGPEGNGTEA